MVVDRGGLRYPVEVIDAFSANLQRFRDEIRKSREEFTKFRRQSKNITKDVSKGEIAASRQRIQASKAENDEVKKRLQFIKTESDRRKIRDRRRTSATKDQQRATKRLAQVEQRAALSRSRASAQAARSARRAAGSQFKLRRAVKTTDTAANKLLFTFRRLVGVLALFTVARQVSAAFGGLIKAGFEFNQTVEQSRLGIAGILVAVADVKNEQGELVKGAEAFAIAQRLAREQMEKLRVDALNTTATFSELLNVFQIATGPGIAIGLDLDQIRQISVLVSQAASNIGLQQNQLSEEIRAIFTGNIRQTTTRLAVVLNLTNEKIRELKALGPNVFFKEMQERLRGFALGAAAAAQTVGGLFVRLKDVVQLVAGSAARGGFENLRRIMQGLFDSLTTITKTKFGDLLRPNPKAQAAFDAIFKAINNILLTAERVGRTLGLDGLTNSAQLFALVLESVGIILVDLILGVVRGFANLRTLMSPLISFFKSLGSLLPAGAANEFLVTLIQIATVLFGLKIGFTLLVGSVVRLKAAYIGFSKALSLTLVKLNSIVAVMKIWSTESKAVAFSLNVIKSRALLMAGAFLFAVKGIQLIAESILGIELELKDLPELFGLMFEKVFSDILSFGDFVFTAIRVRAKQAFNAVVAAAKITAAVLSGKINFFAPEEGDTAAETAAKFRKELEKVPGLAADLKRLNEDNLRLELELTEQKKIQERQDLDATKQQVDRLNRLKKEIELRNKAAEILRKRLEGKRPGEGIQPKDKEVSEQDSQALVKLQRKIELRSIELNLRKKLSDLRDGDASADDRALEAEKLRVQALEARLEIVKRIGKDEEAHFREINKIQLSTQEGLVVQEHTQGRLNALKAKQKLLEESIAIKIKEQELSVERARLVAEGNTGEGLAAGFKDFADQFNSEFLAGLEIARGSMQRFANFVSDSLVAAFDPNNKVNLKERFAHFLQDIAKLIIQQLAQIAIAKAILGLPSGDGFVDITDQFINGFANGFAKGGRIPGRRSQASLAHYTQPQGLAGGGKPIPPRGVDRKDTTPIWAQPGEFMMRLSAVQKYGLGIMNAINRGLIDPGALSSMAGSRRLASTTRRTIGYAAGGGIGSSVRQATQAVGQVAGGGGGGGGPTPAFIVASDQAAERFLAGGRKAVLDFIDENGGDIEGRLSRFRS